MPIFVAPDGDSATGGYSESDLSEYNPNHEPKGSSKGGQFARKVAHGAADLVKGIAQAFTPTRSTFQLAAANLGLKKLDRRKNQKADSPRRRVADWHDWDPYKGWIPKNRNRSDWDYFKGFKMK